VNHFRYSPQPTQHNPLPPVMLMPLYVMWLHRPYLSPASSAALVRALLPPFQSRQKNRKGYRPTSTDAPQNNGVFLIGSLRHVSERISL